tara:strand:+ start:35 stop:196 length:162 start_codon:yes stop_codon:yes gene_type:complete
MEKPDWKPAEEEQEVIEVAWIQVKCACDQIKEETNAKDEHISNMFHKMAERYY